MAWKNVCANDRLSVLPDDVLCNILSFLPTQFSVHTKLLSTRWKQLFTFVPKLDIEYEQQYNRDFNADTISFSQFVDFFFVSYNLSYMNKFRFHLTIWQYPFRNFSLSSWISTVIRLHVKEIDICVLFPEYLKMSPELFYCKTLTNLSLRGRFNIVLPPSISLPCLKTCVFEDVHFDDKSAQRIFRSSPVLETLRLSYCSFRQDGEILDISVPSLKRLIFHGYGKTPQLMLDSPNLVYFEYSGKLSNKLLGLGCLKSVIDAHLHFDDRNAHILELVRSVSHVQQLGLSGNLIQNFLSSGVALPIFNNMTCMGFGPVRRSSLRLLLHLLDNTPRLEFLTFRRDWLVGYNIEDEKNDVFPELVPSCVSQHIKEIDLKEFNGLDFEFELVKYFLKHANNLKVMKMQTLKIWDEQFEVSSATCQIVYYI